MMKKILNVLMCVGLLFQNFAFGIIVFAEEIKEPTIKINGIYQGNTKAEIDENGNYIIDKYDEVFLDFIVENLNENDKYYVEIKDENGRGSGSVYNSFKGYWNQLNIANSYSSNTDDTASYDINICGDWDCNKLYDTKKINIKLDYFDEIKDSKIVISDIKQGNNDFVINDMGHGLAGKEFYLNNKQDVSFKLTGENLIDDADYTISGPFPNELTYKGSELKNGIDIVYSPNTDINHSTNLYLNAYLKGIQISPLLRYFDGKDYYSYDIFLQDDETLPSYNYNLSYTNFTDNKIEKSDLEYSDYYVVNSKYHNDDNTLSLNVNGSDYENRDYSVSVIFKKGNKTIYTKNLNVNGELLNSGYKIELDDLVLELNTEENGELYECYLIIDGITTLKKIKYNSLGKDVNLSSDIFFENGKKNLSVFRGDGNSFFTSEIYDTNKDVFTKYSSIYLRYAGKNFIDDEEYDYILEYGNYIEEKTNISKTYDVELKTGKVMGSKLNSIGLLFKVDNNKNYENPTYKLTIKKGNEMLYASAPVLYIVNSPTLANASLSSNNKTLYLQTSNLTYIATRNAQIYIVISGLGFEDDKTYSFEFCSKDNKKEDYNPEDCKTINIKGRDLNSGVGTAKIKSNAKISKETVSYSFYVKCDMAEADSENATIQGGFIVDFVDSKDLFHNQIKYFVDNVNDLIKNISKNTLVEDFTKSMIVKDNGKVKIYDTTGKNEITGNVGTGMIARVVNEYDENVLDLDVVVKGDVSGDGNISITDLVKVKRHLSQDEKLTGVYEIAGKVSDSEAENIGITDLVKISRDVAKIQEVK